MKYLDFQKVIANRGQGLELMDVELGQANSKEYAIAYTEDGRKFTFGLKNWTEAHEAGLITEKDGNAVVDDSKLVNFDSGLSYIQLEAVKPWSADSITPVGKK